MKDYFGQEISLGCRTRHLRTGDIGLVKRVDHTEMNVMVEDTERTDSQFKPLRHIWHPSEIRILENEPVALAPKSPERYDLLERLHEEVRQAIAAYNPDQLPGPWTVVAETVREIERFDNPLQELTT